MFDPYKPFGIPVVTLGTPTKPMSVFGRPPPLLYLDDVIYEQPIMSPKLSAPFTVEAVKTIPRQMFSYGLSNLEKWKF